MRFPVSKKHSIFLLALFAVFSVAVLLPRVALAQGFLGGIAVAIASAIGSLLVGIVLAVTTVLFILSSLILQLAIDPSFIRIPYTTGPIVDTGWVVVRDLANMLIVFFLIIIGLATALRLGQYEAKKTLPKLIGVALLINFTPVITGFIVDAANIFMNFFLEGLSGGAVLQQTLGNLGSIIGNDVPNFLNPTTSISFLFKLIAIAIFQVFAAVVFFLFAVLFIMRRVAIWILVILSPIAFVASVLPKTSSLFKMWWAQFSQWTIIGIFAAFFLWLGDHMMSIAAQGTLVAPAPESTGVFIGGGVTTILNAIMPFGIALLMLLIGFFVALQSSAMGAGAAQAFGMKALGWAGKSSGSAFWRKYGEAAAKPGSKMAALGSRMQQWGSSQQGIGGRMMGVTASVAGFAVRKVGEPLRSGAQELTKQVHFKDSNDHESAIKEGMKMGDSQDVFATINTELLKPIPNKNRILGLLNAVRNRGDADDIQDAFDPAKNGALVGKEAMIGGLIKTGKDRIGPNGERPLFKAFYGQIMTAPEKWGFNIDKDKDMLKDADGKLKKDDAGRIIFKDIERDAEGNTVLGENGKPKLTKDARKGSDVQYLEGMKSKIPARMAGADFTSDEITPSNFDPTTEAGEAFIRSMMKERGAELIGSVIRRREASRRKAITDFLNTKVDNDWLGKNAPDVLTWFTSTAAQGLGISRISSETGKALTPVEARGIVEVHQPTVVSMQKVEESIAGIQKQLTELRRPGSEGAVSLSQTSLDKIKELEDDQTRQQKNLLRMRENFRPPATPSPTGGTAPPPTGGTPPPPQGRTGPGDTTPRGRPGSFA